MTEYITKSQAIEIGADHGFDITGWKNQVALKNLCNAAIQRYRDSLVAELVLPELPYWSKTDNLCGLVPTDEKIKEAVRLLKYIMGRTLNDNYRIQNVINILELN